MNKIEEYFKSNRVSNSLLGTMNNPRFIWLKEQGLIEDPDRPFFRVGSAIDCLLTDPERWEEEFAVSEGNKPSGLLGKFVDALPRHINKWDEAEVYQDAYKTAGYKASLENVIKWFWENESAVKYYKDRFLVESGKELLGKEEYDAVRYAVDVIKENQFTRKYFVTQEGEGNIERLLQLPIYFDIGGTECKALLDGVLIDHDNKTIQPFDLKSTGKKVTEFPLSFTQFGYYRQAAFYELALRAYLSQREQYDTKDLNSYTMLPFKFIVIESKPGYSPALIFECTENDIYCGLFGGYTKTPINRFRGIYDLLEDYRWHKLHNKWQMPREAYENEGVLRLDLFLNENDL